MPARAVSKVTQKNVETWAVGECLKPHKIARQKFAQVYGLGLQIWLLLHKQIRLILCLPERALCHGPDSADSATLDDIFFILKTRALLSGMEPALHDERLGSSRSTELLMITRSMGVMSNKDAAVEVYDQ